MIPRLLLAFAVLIPAAAWCDDLPQAPQAQSQSPEQASESIQDTFRKLASPRAAANLPSYADVQKEKQRQEFAPREGQHALGGVSATPLANRNSAEYLYQGAPRHVTKRAEGYFLHAADGRLDVGAGYADIRDRDGNAYWNHEIPKYGVIRWTLGGDGPREKRRFMPSGSYTESEVSPKMLVSPHEITVDTTKKAIRDAAGGPSAVPAGGGGR